MPDYFSAIFGNVDLNMDGQLDGKAESDFDMDGSKYKSSTGSSLNQTCEDSIFTNNSIFLSDHSSLDVYGAKEAPAAEVRACNTMDVNPVYSPSQATA